MNRRYKNTKRTFRFKDILLAHLENNLKEYLIICLIFLIGIIIGVLYINKASDYQKEEIITYINTFTSDLKENKNVNEIVLLINSIKKNVFLAIFLWFMGSTIIGISIVYLTICFRGFCFGYTVSSIILALGSRKRNDFFIRNIIFTKYIIYTWNCHPCGKWNKFT